jgi:hypothetical protein
MKAEEPEPEAVNEDAQPMKDAKLEDFVVLDSGGVASREDAQSRLGGKLLWGDGGPTQREKTPNDHRLEYLQRTEEKRRKNDQRWKRATQIFSMVATLSVVWMLKLVLDMKTKSDARDSQYLKNIATYELLRENSIKGLDMHGQELNNQHSGLSLLKKRDSLADIDHQIIEELARRMNLNTYTFKPKSK